jgi:hypothetical protein
MKSRRIALTAFNLLILFLFTTGFRTFSSTTPWNIRVSDPKLFLKFCERPNITNNDLDRNDPLFGQTLTFNVLLQSILNDYNNIPSSFLVLADADTDPESATKTKRTINICFGQTTSGGGEARPKVEGSLYSGCEIALSSSIKSSANAFIKTVTHEIGHCLGLDHTQETIYSVMSYFSDVRAPRLQIDDMMALVYLYPTDPKYSKETSTLGLSCTPKG